MPRARRASAPPRVFFHNPTRVRPHDQKNASGSGISMDHAPTMNLFSKRNPQYSPLRLVPPRTVGTHFAIVHEEPHLGLPDDCDCDAVHQVFSSSKLVTSEELRWIEDTETDVARVTQRLVGFAQINYCCFYVELRYPLLFSYHHSCLLKVLRKGTDCKLVYDRLARPIR